MASAQKTLADLPPEGGSHAPRKNREPLVMTLASTLVRALRAVRIDPIVAIRGE
jgi:hypothetical protein